MLPASHPLLYACAYRDSALVADLAHAPPPHDGGAAEDDAPAVAAALVAGAPAHHRHVTHTASGRAHAVLLAPPLVLAAVSRAPQLPSSHLLLFLRRLRCLPGNRMRDEMPRLALRLPFPDEEALAREAGEVAAAEAEAEEAERREGELARRTPKRERRARSGGAGWTWRRKLWLIVLADLVLLFVLFAAWLAVCKGFSCIGR
ncbi:unknown protein [Oryza sativa Japonica Group]|jgi:hypothetical protein|uniref:Os01g0236000 protein n=4 Tax=Oryza TaxID=4527 RepID=A0A0P0V0R2_ORYSJ|nr:uncharacterized protein LOC4327784 [Oryza sativa Japonica Group]EEC70259.1 hypothetical protein OsI_01063 [Oryza sativa Indica Group]KAB8080690.1 hypothetical protein EE612_001319 [Oryza sativa]KAF2949306.1 hypothetical protein DAI22_01g096100 [Oryza sativa Japonica Group]BAD81268.1 unknown protein [Oryza sativa Japonica Group]BAF04441.1 Os01g0236000 [Oryza sativa Japonica Group]|eukprot:NP_001042527.1 Os01g0236000 [Oryza sativa Japonica Group]